MSYHLDDNQLDRRLTAARTEGWEDSNEFQGHARKLGALAPLLVQCRTGMQWYSLSEVHSVLKYSFNTLREAYALCERISGKYPSSLESGLPLEVRRCEAAHSELSGAYHKLKKQARKAAA